MEPHLKYQDIIPADGGDFCIYAAILYFEEAGNRT
jgi:hypothetical protein